MPVIPRAPSFGWANQACTIPRSRSIGNNPRGWRVPPSCAGERTRLHAIREKSTLGNPRVGELSPVILGCPAASPVPAFFSLRASAVWAAASAEPGLASPLPGEPRVPADALSAASAGEEQGHSGSARDDNSVALSVDGHCLPGPERWDEAHLADSRVATEAADRFPDDWRAELASDDCSVVAARARDLAPLDSESPVDDTLASLSQADCWVVGVLADCWVAMGLVDCSVVVGLADC
jgi:hypothetical protein